MVASSAIYSGLPEVLQESRQLAGSPMNIEEQVLQEFNSKYAIVRTSTTYILMEKSEHRFELDTRGSFQVFHENDYFTNSHGRSQSKAAFWLKHPRRRTFEEIVFDPQRPGNYGNCFNIFKGFAVQPKPGDASFYWDHIAQVICSGNLVFYRYVRKWMACVVQHPTLLATALVLRGLQGTGKSKFVEYFGSLFGRYFMTVNSLDHLVGRFNSHLKYAYLVYANEAIWTGDRKEIGALKAFVTDPTIIIEGKGRDAIQVGNCRHLIVTTNEEWAVPMDLDDRRFFVLNVSPHRKEDIPYFARLDAQMASGGREALLFDLLNESLQGFDPRIMPMNDQGFDIKMLTASSSVRFIYESLKEGQLNLATKTDGDWRPYPCERIYRFYRDWCVQDGLRFEASSELGKNLHKLLRVRRARRSLEGVLSWWYELGDLSEAREAFQNFTKQSASIWLS